MRVRDLSVSDVGYVVSVYRDGMFNKGQLTEMYVHTEVADVTAIEDEETQYAVLRVYTDLELDFGATTLRHVHPDTTVEIQTIGKGDA